MFKRRNLPAAVIVREDQIRPHLDCRQFVAMESAVAHWALVDA